MIIFPESQEDVVLMGFLRDDINSDWFARGAVRNRYSLVVDGDPAISINIASQPQTKDILEGLGFLDLEWREKGAFFL